MPNIYLKVTIEEKWRTQTSILKVWKLHLQVGSGSKTLFGFSIFYFERSCNVLKSRSRWFFLNKNIIKNWKSHIVLATWIMCFSSYRNCECKSKTVMSWSSRKKKECIFCNVYFARRNFFLTFRFFLNV